MMEQEKGVMLYMRRGDAVYVIPNGLTTIGARVSVEPFEYLHSDSTASEIWAGVEKALQSANRIVPHPRQSEWKNITPWYEKAGARTWGEFIGKAKRIVSVAQTRDTYVFQRHYRSQGKVLGDSETKQVLPRGTGRESIIEAFGKYWSERYNT